MPWLCWGAVFLLPAWGAGLGSARDPDAWLSCADQLSSAGHEPHSAAAWPASWRWARASYSCAAPSRRRQSPGRLQQEEIRVQAAVHLPAGPRHRLRAHGGCEPAQLQQIHREADCECEAGRCFSPGPLALCSCSAPLSVWGFPCFRWGLTGGRPFPGAHLRGWAGPHPCLRSTAPPTTPFLARHDVRVL